MRFCARVLAAALMVGAIGAALAFPARFGPGETQPRVLTAPPSTQQRTLYVPAVPAPRPRAALVVTHIHRSVTSPLPAGSSLAAARSVTAPRAAQQVAAQHTPVRSHRVAPAPRELASATPPVSAPTATAAKPAPVGRHGHGHGYGREKANGKPPITPPLVATAPAPPPTADDGDAEHANDGAAAGAVHGNGHAYGHDKQEAVGG